MFPSQVASYNDDDLIGTDATTADDNFDPTHPLYQAHRRPGRAARPTTRRCATAPQIHRYAASGAGIYAFSPHRLRDEQRRVRRRGQQRHDASRPRQIPTYSSGMGFAGIWPAAARRRRPTPPARLPVTVPPLSAVVYRAATAVAAERRHPIVTLTRARRGRRGRPASSSSGRRSTGRSSPR